MLDNPMMDGGGVALHFCGAPRRLRFEWNAFGVLRAKYGGAVFQDNINAGLFSCDFDVIAECLSFGIGGELSAAAIKADPPAIVPAITALHKAFNLAYHGPDGPPKEKPRPLAMARAALARMREAARAILSRMLSSLG